MFVQSHCVRILGGTEIAPIGQSRSVFVHCSAVSGVVCQIHGRYWIFCGLQPTLHFTIKYTFVFNRWQTLFLGTMLTAPFKLNAVGVPVCLVGDSLAFPEAVTVIPRLANTLATAFASDFCGVFWGLGGGFLTDKVIESDSFIMLFSTDSGPPCTLSICGNPVFFGCIQITWQSSSSLSEGVKTSTRFRFIVWFWSMLRLMGEGCCIPGRIPFWGILGRIWPRIGAVPAPLGRTRGARGRIPGARFMGGRGPLNIRGPPGCGPRGTGALWLGGIGAL